MTLTHVVWKCCRLRNMKEATSLLTTTVINKELQLKNHSLNKDKIHFSGAKKYKIVTGCAISPTGTLRVKNAHRKDIMEANKKINNNSSIKEIESLIGKIQSARQIEPYIGVVSENGK